MFWSNILWCKSHTLPSCYPQGKISYLKNPKRGWLCSKLNTLSFPVILFTTKAEFKINKLNAPSTTMLFQCASKSTTPEIFIAVCTIIVKYTAAIFRIWSKFRFTANLDPSWINQCHYTFICRYFLFPKEVNYIDAHGEIFYTSYWLLNYSNKYIIKYMAPRAKSIHDLYNFKYVHIEIWEARW